MAAHVENSTDECLKSGAYIEDTIFDPARAFSAEPNESPLNVAFKTDLTIWEWYETPSNKRRLHRFSVAMEGSRQAASPNEILNGTQTT